MTKPNDPRDDLLRQLIEVLGRAFVDSEDHTDVDFTEFCARELLAAAGLSITETPDEWEWGVKWSAGFVAWEGVVEADARATCAEYEKAVLVRRRPATDWEPVS